MTEHVTGTAGIITARRVECEQAIAQLAAGGLVNAKVVKKLRGRLGDELADLVLSIAALQGKAWAKLGPDHRVPQGPDRPVWWVTEKSLQQATAWQVAQLKSKWFGDRYVYDLCCGIGGDATVLAGRGRLAAFDSDPLVAEMAAANLAHTGQGVDRAHASCADVTRIEIPPDAAIHIDPDRRPSRDRSSSPVHSQPSWPEVLRLVGGSKAAVVKLAPAARVEPTDLGPSHQCWISLTGTVREQSLLLGDVIDQAGLTPGARSAAKVASDGSASWFVPGSNHPGNQHPPARGVDIAAQPRSVLIDPDASVRAAGLTEAFAGHHGLKLLGAPSGFLTCDQLPSPISSVASMAVMGNVIWFGPCDDRRLRREFRSRGVFPAIIKVRGTEHEPTSLAKRYRGCGDQAVTLWIGRTQDRVFAAITK